MDIRKAEHEQMKRLIQEWIDHPEQELEATFGVNGQVNATTFSAIGKRLKNRGYTSTTQEDKLNIITPNHVRISLSGLGVIQQYCRDDRLAGRKFSAIIKDRATKSAQQDTLDLQEYGVRIKSRRERELGEKDADVVELLDQWGVQQKAFRLLRRWTFRGDGIRYDLSMVRQTQRNKRGDYRWVTKFTQQDISKELPVYEVEVELERVEGDTVDAAIQRLIKGVGEILRGIQKNSLLIRESVKRQVLSAYQQLTKTDRFRGVSTRTLELKNMLSQAEPGIPNIRDGYNVTDKADGLRAMGYVNETGHFYMIDGALNVYETGLQVPESKNSLVDGEWITKDKANGAIHQYLIFDIYYAAGARDVHGLPFYDPVPTATGAAAPCRYIEMLAWDKVWKSTKSKEVIKGLTPKTTLLVSLKKFGFAKGSEIFQVAAKIYDTPRIYETDGLIFTKNSEPLPDRPQGDFKQQMKWKPAHDNTIDFLVVTEKLPGSTIDAIHNGFHPTSGKEIRYKVFRLHVGSRDDPSKTMLKPRDIVLQIAPLLPARGSNVYRPVLFQPEDFPDDQANVCYVEVRTDMETGDEYAFCEHSNEPITDKSIVEISYDASRPSGWRWVPKLVRKDKTERLMSGELGRTLNSNETAQSIWNSIHEPVTLSMVRTGSEEPDISELTAISTVEKERAAITNKYMDRTASEKDIGRVGPLRDFHNKYIKEVILYSSVMKKPGLSIIDIGVGVAQDIQKWRRQDAAAVLGIDIAGDSINNPHRGAYQRLWSTMVRNGRDKVLPMAFAIGDGSKNMSTGEAGATVEDRVILQSVLGRTRPEGVVPPYIEKELASRFKMGADIMSCMFAVHYFFETKEKFDGFLKNVAENLKVGGYFIGCCFDGEKTFNMLRGHQSKQGVDGDALLWTITKKYDADDIPDGDDAFGMPIDVEFISIGVPHREYLVPFKLLTSKMRSIGCELCNADDLEAVGMRSCTELFNESHKVAAKAGRKFPMTKAVEEFSFLNRWFIFRRRGDIQPSDPAAPDAAATATAPAPDATAPAAATAAATEPVARNAKRQYALGEVLQIRIDASSKDVLKIGDANALSWIAPGSPFPIQDATATPPQSYPSIEHFLAGMKYTFASDKPGLGPSIFGSGGSIHIKYLTLRGSESGMGSIALSDERNKELLGLELKEIRDSIALGAMKKLGVNFNKSRWAELEDTLITDAVTQRWTKDARFRTIVDAAKQQGKTLLFYTGSASSIYGGKRTAEGYLEGENKIGKAMMEVAGFT